MYLLHRAGLTAALWLSPMAVLADCPPVDFEDLPVGTAVTTQYPGVTFSVLPQSCDSAPTLYMRIQTAEQGTASGTRTLEIDTGCPDFSVDYVRMRFDALQREVSFYVGEATGAAGYRFDIRYYSDAGLLGTLHVDSGSGINRWVHIGSSGSPATIRRVEVDSPIDAYEALDDLSFGGDTTPPVVRIDSPIFETVGCAAVTLNGVACEPDGEYVGDKLEILAVDAPAGTNWTLVDDATTPQCAGGLLYVWNTAGMAHGRYYVRITAENACGLTASALTVVLVDRKYDTVELRSPAEGQVIGGQVCVDGTAWDYLGFDEYTVRFQPTAGGAWQPVDAAHPSYTIAVINDPLATWNTAAVADGSYRLRVDAVDDCGNTMLQQHTVVLDNTPPVATLRDPVFCERVSGVVPIFGTALDANLERWTVQYAGGTTSGWTTIATGTAPASDELLGYWDTGPLPVCAYALRLVVTDRAVLDCGPSVHRVETVRAVSKGPLGDMNCDGLVNFFDIDPFVNCLFTLDCDCP